MKNISLGHFFQPLNLLNFTDLEIKLNSPIQHCCQAEKKGLVEENLKEPSFFK